MASEDSNPRDFLTPQELRQWLIEEATRIRVTTARHIKEARSFVEAYEKGKLSPEQAHKEFSAYLSRWSDRLGLEDRQVESQIEKTTDKILNRAYRQGTTGKIR